MKQCIISGYSWSYSGQAQIRHRKGSVSWKQYIRDPGIIVILSWLLNYAAWNSAYEDDFRLMRNVALVETALSLYWLATG
jgi:hypothetical protein